MHADYTNKIFTMRRSTQRHIRVRMTLTLTNDNGVIDIVKRVRFTQSIKFAIQKEITFCTLDYYYFHIR